MNAIVSARSGIALLIDGESLTSFGIDAPDELTAREPEEYQRLLAGADDVEFHTDVDQEFVQRELVRRVACEDALDLILFLLDSQVSDEGRDLAAQDLNELLAESGVEQYLEEILYARPLPASADAAGAADLLSNAAYKRADELVKRLIDHQPAIAAVREAWEVVSHKEFIDSSEARAAEGQLIAAGLFRVFARAVAANSASGMVQLEAVQLLQKHRAADLKQIVQAWSGQLPVPKRRLSPKPRTKQPHSDSKVKESKKTRRDRKNRRHSRSESSQGQQPRVDTRRVNQEVESDKRKIVQLMRKGDIVDIRAAVNHLVEFQMMSGGREFAAKSLCDLAIRAKELSWTALQIELTERATKSNPNDPWALIQHASSLYDAGELDHAKELYESALDSGLDGEHHAVAQNGRAEVLKAQGELDSALAAYDAVIADHPRNAVAQNGRAEVLKAQGELDSALAAYDAVIADHPRNAVAQNGRAEVLKAQGELDSALAAYDAVIADHPRDAVAQNGRAALLGSLGRFAKALSALSDSEPKTIEDWIGFHIRGMIQLRSGDADSARQTFQRGLNNCPFAITQPYFASALAITEVAVGEFVAAANRLADTETESAPTWVNVVRVHALGASRQSQAAREIFAKRQPDESTMAVEAWTELRIRYIDDKPATHDDAWLVDREIRMALLDRPVFSAA